VTDLLSIGASGVRAYQTALGTTSENIANAATPGYSKRSVTMSELAAPAVPMTKIANGDGVIVSGVTRSADDLRAAAVRSSGADLAKSEASATWLERIDSALGGNALGDRLTSFFNASTALAADASSLAARSTMVEAAQSVANAFSSTGSALDAAASDLDISAETAVDQLNSQSAALAKVNAALGRATSGSASAASLLDQRDQILESMSAISDLTVSYDSAGRASVRAGDASGPLLVQGDSAATVTYVRSGGNVSYAAHRDGETSAVLPNGGALAGFAEAAQRIDDARTAIDDQARAFAEGVNAVQAAGEDLNGAAGEPMFTIGDPASQLTLALTDPRGIAAASVGGGTRSNANLDGLTTLRNTGNVEGAITDLTAANGAALAARRQVAEAQTTIRDNAVAARDSVSGVNTDEEAVDLLRFQQAYQASSRVIQVARDTFQSILDIR
jgi:flagellar hook-associated protein 1